MLFCSCGLREPEKNCLVDGDSVLAGVSSFGSPDIVMSMKFYSGCSSTVCAMVHKMLRFDMK